MCHGARVPTTQMALSKLKKKRKELSKEVGNVSLSYAVCVSHIRGHKLGTCLGTVQFLFKTCSLNFIYCTISWTGFIPHTYSRLNIPQFVSVKVNAMMYNTQRHTAASTSKFTKRI